MSPGSTEDGEPVLQPDTMQWNNSGWTEKPWSAPHLAPLFTELTSAKSAPSWARRAVKIIHRYTREHGEPPTFRELFTELAAQDPDYADHEEAWSSDAGALDAPDLAGMGALPDRDAHSPIRPRRERRPVPVYPFGSSWGSASRSSARTMTSSLYPCM